jgi:diguanylate cyclase (GGDEF)-like protein/PAS domain S-box-containing protein
VSTGTNQRGDRDAPGGDSERRFQTMVEHIPMIVTYMDLVEDDALRPTPVYMSPQIEDLLGYPRDDWLTDEALWLRVLHRGDLERMLEEDDRARRALGPSTVEYRMIAPDGRVVWVSETATFVTDEATSDVYWQGVMVDITARKERDEEALVHRALHDGLTGLPNRQLFLDRLRTAIERRDRPVHAPSTAVIFLDLDGFKRVNDGMGHDAGDRLLVAVAGRLEEGVRPGDTAARFGGDEFVVIAENVVSLDQAQQLAVRLGRSIEQPFLIDGEHIVITVSIGVSMTSDLDAFPEDVVRSADAAMFEAKADGRNRVVVGEVVRRS